MNMTIIGILLIILLSLVLFLLGGALIGGIITYTNIKNPWGNKDTNIWIKTLCLFIIVFGVLLVVLNGL